MRNLYKSKILAIAIIAILLANLLLFALRIVNVYAFWVIIGMCALASWGMKYADKNK